MASPLRVVFALVVVIAIAGCYKPNLQDGGLRCTDAGACPEGYHCAGDGMCHKGGTMTCQPDAGHVAPLCTPEPGNDCDPICQSRCQCGRCNLVGAALACVPAGAKKRGDLCNANNDDCAPGNVCIKDCSDRIARCYRFCGKGNVLNDAICELGQPCDITLNDPSNNPTEYTVCEPPVAGCNPVGNSGECGDPALACYVAPGGATVCDCQGAGQPAGPCGPYNSCIAGFRCVQVMGVASCFKTCRRSGADCTAPSTCTMLPGDATFGFCP